MTVQNDQAAASFRRCYREIHGTFGYNFDADLRPEKTALVVVDMQPAFVDSRYPMTRANNTLLPNGTAYFESRVRDSVLPRTRELLDSCRDRGSLVVFVVTWSETDDLSDMVSYQKQIIRKWEQVAGEQVYRKWNAGMDVCPEIAPLEHELIVPKRTGSAFASSNLPVILHNAGVETVILTGVNTNGCVFETAVVGKNLGFTQLLASDATACFEPLLQEVAEVWMNRHFATVHTSAEIIAMLNNAAAPEAP